MDEGECREAFPVTTSGEHRRNEAANQNTWDTPHYVEQEPSPKTRSFYEPITFNSGLTFNLASVAFCTSSAVRPGATSARTKPAGVTAMQAISVTIVFTTPTPVRGSVHFFSIFGWPSRVVCSIATTTRFAPATRSIAPPMPFTIF